MVLVSQPPPALHSDHRDLFFTTDDLLSNAPIFVFHGPPPNATLTSHAARLQIHIYTPAGLQAYPRLTISPDSHFYAAVKCLPREDQADEVVRALAYSIYKYFHELPSVVRSTWESKFNTIGKLPSAPELFSDAHAAILASRMLKVENTPEVVRDIKLAHTEQSVSWQDVDVVLPPGSVHDVDDRLRESVLADEATEEDVIKARYAKYAALIKPFGQPAFIPTSRLRRAPSRPSGLSRSNTFSKQQKESLRRELIEFVDTEESYVGKLYDLLHSVAEDFRQKARSKSPESSSPTEEALQGLFPPSLDDILAKNTAFLDDIRRVIEESENDAIQDIESTATDASPEGQSKDGEQGDVTGVLPFADCLVDWFPKFSDCYTDYIQAHAEFGQYLRIFLRETESSFSKRVQEKGEQRLMSMLIEPVQRLPRYSLFIDNLVKQLPLRHPALRPLLKARDIVSEICSRDSPSGQISKVIERLRHLIPLWPQTFNPEGRLITAMDVVELPPPYRNDPNVRGAIHGILLLFSDALVLLGKSGHKTMSARGLLAEIDNPSVPLDETPQIATQLIFLKPMKLSNVWFTEVNGGTMVQMHHSDGAQDGDQTQQTPKARKSINASSLCMFLLQGSYEGKASRWLEETAKARVEYRFPEAERESTKWEARSQTGDINVFSAIFEDGHLEVHQGRREPARVRVVFDPPKGPKAIKPGDQGVEVVASVTPASGGMHYLELEGLNGFASRDRILAEEILSLLTKKVGIYMQMRNQIRNPDLTAVFLQRNQQVLNSLKVRTQAPEEESPALERTGSGRGSPVKMLSSLFGGSMRDYGSSRRLHRPTPSLGEIPRLPPAPSSPHKPSSRPSSRDDANTSKTSLALPDLANDPLFKLEDTLAAYVLALHARKGNVVGRTIRNRANADELAVNELYNALLEDPKNIDLAAQQPVDVLFKSFEKFLHVAWRENVGLVVPVEVLRSLQSQPDLYPGDFEEHFKNVLNHLSAQNQRALRACLKLLADLLEGTGNDGDRGIITAAFAEVLVPEGNAHDFITLLDRFIEDVDGLFGRPMSSGSEQASQGSTNSRYSGKIAGSLNSNTSLKKRFGFGNYLHRENSKSDLESKVSHVWRTLSKSGRNADGQASSMSKATPLVRSHSTDQDTRLSPKRPGSRDRPTVLGAFAFADETSGRTLATIGETRESPKKKRRSSLSDLLDLQASQESSPSWSPKAARKPNLGDSGIPTTPSPTRRTGIPTSSSSRLSMPAAKRDMPSPAANSALPRPRTLPGPETVLRPSEPNVKREEIVRQPSKIRSKAMSENIPPDSPRRKPDTSVNRLSGIPGLHKHSNSASSVPTALSERPGIVNRPRTAGNTTAAGDDAKPNGVNAPVTFSPTKKLRMQSPQKLRERLQKEQNAIKDTEKELQAELSQIGQELSGLSLASSRTVNSSSPLRPSVTRTQTESSTTRLRPAPLKTSKSVDDTSATSGNTNNTAQLSARIAALESKTTSLLSSLSERNATLAEDITSSLTVSESRFRGLDDLYRKAGAENEALYSQFNEELARVLKAVKSSKAGEDVDALRRKVTESVGESERLRKENWRLRREVVGLRAQLKEG
ncbi:uncharacterized protein IWZ02DRAFT_188433 [Phyllosticta citriasiana]|uniref:DH domain-containing protein n=1 Tax=Phyllosticta citriasiana TaxID=595635 RepID=A0ABR1KGC0_9PEZI